MPRAAILIQGQPRFCAEFDQFLACLDPAWDYDWYMWLWNPNPGPDVYGFELIAPRWRDFKAPEAREHIQSLLGNNHRVLALATADQNQLVIPQVHHKAGETNVANVWKMFYSQYQADLLRQQSGLSYDLVIKARPDVGVQGLNVNQCWAQLQSDPQQVIFSKENHHGYVGTRVNDWVAVGLEGPMSVYSSVWTAIPEYCRRGMIYHPETLLSHHLTQNSVKITYGDYLVSLRQLGKTVDHKYFSQFGRWQ